MTKEKFDLKYRGEKVAVHCDTEEKAKAFLSLAKSFGYTWINGDSLDNQNYIENYGGALCLKLEDIFNKQRVIIGTLEHCKDDNYKIISFELDEPKETFNVGDVVYTKTGFKAKIVDTAWVVEFENTNGTFFRRHKELSKTKPLKEISEKELADMGFVIKK